MSSGEESEAVPNVASAAECVEGENGWHYDVGAEQTPTSVVLCPRTCDQIISTPGTRVDIVLGCQTLVRVR